MFQLHSPRVSARKAGSFNPQSFIRIEVGKGEETKSFNVQENVLSEFTSFFERGLRFPIWKENQDQVVKLPEDDPKIFELYLHAIYRGELPTLEDDPEIDSTTEHEYETLCKLFVLAEKLVDGKTKNLVIRAIFAATEQRHVDGIIRYPDSNSVTIAFEGTPENCNLRALLSALYVHCANASWWEGEVAECWPKEFLFMVARDSTSANNGLSSIDVENGLSSLDVEEFLEAED
ncbi:hypothetical protein BDV96DRAFT_483324 [Lophiotrema nucula]|uniref:BTB domain-containing protein n=1 Tax=Lophiotrema nucula TaxID=690887 RepID=A0A6A5ZTB4_9PLEO|nr:hypothetical protein BDV96DRAFT_483324 [Lophiotrema nucula]